ncbi:hypothetical protein BD311DRAFT_771234 [Dichomitus squalens]|uniref:Uncharacterized protein n=1 Tax=Dichomitus squalens TaxID=114155 RepID=A0A4V2JYQ3_9APHY|nr:hypothetical protein BD311DRAFT_771234 [Dichomitus squalens]
MTALPPIAEARRLIPPLDDTAISLYATLALPAEEAASKAANAKDLMYSRVVGYLLFYASNATALATLKDDIASCDTADQGPLQALYNLGEFYVKNLLLIFRKTRGRTPVPSDHPSRPSFEVAKSQVMEDLQSTPRNHSDAKLAALARDNFRLLPTAVSS